MQGMRWVMVGAVAVLAAISGVTSAPATLVSVGRSGWTSAIRLQGDTLNDVTFVGARGFAVGDFGTVLRSEDGGANWIGLPSGTKSNLSLVQEVDPNTVIVGGGCTVESPSTAVRASSAW